MLIQQLSKLLNQENQQVVSMLFNYFEQLFRYDKLDEVDWQALDKTRTELVHIDDRGYKKRPMK